MPKEMLINVSEGEECRIALLDDGRLEELYMERTSSTSHVGNIYKGRVTNVEPSIQAAFVDFGLGRNGFLHISDLMPTYFGRKGEDIQESVGRKMSRRDRPPIQRCLRRGDEIIVQIIKEGIGTKGPTLSTYLSIPGRILVMMPGMGKMGVSKKIEDEEERRRLRQILDGLKPPKGVGFIIRTAGIGKTKAEIERDLKYLTRLWETIDKKQESGPGPIELYTEGDLVTRTVRDVFTTDVERLIVDSKDVAKRVKEVIKLANPRTKNKVELYDEPVPLFHKYGIEKEIELMYSRHVPLPSGGSLVIDSTEAIVAIDVNSGKFRDHSDAETTAFKTDMEAADEIPRQLRLRDLGGVIICDFIDLRFERHRRELEQRLHDNLKNDRAKTKVLRMSQFGIIEMTRQRMRPSLKRSIYFDCPHCKGAGLVKTPESMSLDVMRRLAIAANDARVMRIELAVCPDVGFSLLNRKRAQLADLESETKKRILIRSELGLGLDEMKLTLFDNRDGLVIVEELQSTMSGHPHTTQLGTRRPSQQGRRHDQRRDQRREQPKGRDDRHSESDVDERFDLDSAEDAVEQREETMEREPSSDDSAVETAVGEQDGRPTGRSGPAERTQDRGNDVVGESEQGQGGRRRRRRGRRGRGRGGDQGKAGNQNGPSAQSRPPVSRETPSGHESESGESTLEGAEDRDAEHDIPEPGNEAEGYQSEGQEKDQEDEGGQRRRRRRRGGRRRRGRGGQDQQSNGESPGSRDADEVKGSSPKATQAPPPSQRAKPEVSLGVTPITRTGSSDRHLASDEPIAPEPSRRPRSYRDLDAIPDDFD